MHWGLGKNLRFRVHMPVCSALVSSQTLFTTALHYLKGLNSTETLALTLRHPVPKVPPSATKIHAFLVLPEFKYFLFVFDCTHWHSGLIPNSVLRNYS